MRYLVITILERALESVTSVDTHDEAVAVANDMLKRHCRDIGYEAEYAEFEAAVRDDPSENLTREEIRMATKRSNNAWTNIGGVAWDAHVHDTGPC